MISGETEALAEIDAAFVKKLRNSNWIIAVPSDALIKHLAVCMWEFDAEGEGGDCFDDIAPWHRDAYFKCAEMVLNQITIFSRNNT